MSLANLKRVDRAAVLKDGVRAATLLRTQGGVQFGYQPGYSGEALAFTLPLGPEPVFQGGGALPPFFAGLLPEGRRLNAIVRATKTSADDELTLLLAVGEDTVGDVQVVPDEGRVLETSPASADTKQRPLSEVDFEELFASAIGTAPSDLMGIAGLQDKVSARMITLPVELQGAAWILKLNPPEFPHLVENEAFFLGAARDSNLDAAEAKLVHDRQERPGLLVRRFDRVVEGPDLRRLAQEDACQVMGLYPADKYRVTTEQVALALMACTAAPLVAARNLIRQFAFGYLTGNGDIHAKNVSVLRREEWVVAPAYDLPSSLPYGDRTMALSINDRDGENIRRKDFFALGESVGVPAPAVARVLDELLKSMPKWWDKLPQLPFPAPAIRKLSRTLELRAKRLSP